MAQIDDLEALAKRHGATSYRNRADTQNPAFGFSAAGLASLLAEVRKQDEALIRQLVAALEGYRRAEFRRIGVHYSGNARRADVDAARKQGENLD